MAELQIRLATADDLEAVNDIYNHYVLNSVTTYQEEPEPIEGRRAWFASHGPRHPITVAVKDGRVVGWAALSPFHRRSAYRNTVENSVYVDRAHYRQGIGHALLADSLERARRAGHHTVIAMIDGEQEASVALHRKAGFSQIGFLREVGSKFGRRLNVYLLQKMLDAPDALIPPPPPPSLPHR